MMKKNGVVARICFSQIYSVSFFLLRVAGLFGVCLIMGCAFRDGTTTHIIGYARIVETESPADGVVLKGVQMVGARVGDGIGVGYFNEKRIIVPLDCRLVVIVRNRTQLEEVSRRLAGLQRRELCVAIEP